MTTRGKSTRSNERWAGTSSAPLQLQDVIYDNTVFEGLTIQNAICARAEFRRCHFKNCYLGFDVEYQDCLWDRCRFTGKYTSFGWGGRFLRSNFRDCLIQGVSLDGVRIEGCTISGTLKNVTARGAFVVDRKAEFSISDSDLSGCTFDNANFVLGVDLSTVQLPRAGIRVFDNTGERFRQALLEAAECTDLHTRSALKVLVVGEGQKLVVLDERFLEDMLDTPEARSKFDAIARQYENASIGA